jgi:mRNA-degrading endonuclease YafQ of YafQ-DinJ toxin-antitoxin module
MAGALMAVQIKLCKLFKETAKKYFTNPKVKEAYEKFAAAKLANPMEPFGSKDLPFKGGDLKGYLHVALANDIRLIYSIEGKDPKIIKVYYIGNHDESGTGQPPNPKRQKQLATKLGNQTFESRR